MKSFYCFLVLMLLVWINALAQDPHNIIKAVLEAQKKIETASYKIQRVDTFVSGTIWNNTGEAIIKMHSEAPEFGFLFWSKRNDMSNVALFDGSIAYDIDTVKKTYRTIQKKENLFHITGSPGGQMVFRELFRLDTAKAVDFELAESPTHYYLTLKYADVPEYNILNKYKWLAIDKKSMLPVEMIDHMSALGKKQSNHFKVKELQLNSSAFSYNFINNSYVQRYQQEVSKPNTELLSLLNVNFPAFAAKTFGGQPFSSDYFRGKTILLDFWEVWCGPCIASMDKVQSLFDKYKNKGLEVYGIINEPENLEPSKIMVEKKRVNFPMLLGNEDVKGSFKLSAIPLYVLIDRTGKIVFVQEGFNDELEQAVKKALDL